MSVPKHRVEALANYVRRTTKKGLRAFPGSISFYRRYVKHLASQTVILTPLTTKRAPQRVEWSVEGECAFVTILNFFGDMSVLCIPVSSDVFSIV